MFFFVNFMMTLLGFCLLNTVGVAAAHARCRYSIGRSSTSQDPSQGMDGCK